MKKFLLLMLFISTSLSFSQSNGDIIIGFKATNQEFDKVDKILKRKHYKKISEIFDYTYKTYYVKKVDSAEYRITIFSGKKNKKVFSHSNSIVTNDLEYSKLIFDICKETLSKLLGEPIDIFTDKNINNPNVFNETYNSYVITKINWNSEDEAATLGIYTDKNGKGKVMIEYVDIKSLYDEFKK